ncbi:MAG TPA: nickel pincer cofactor biosynthesis protein LarB [Lachnospiraceae bacterium]|nr:nickel pincer cofactor biosynthesis protein LarB [Lachnospiraceae bacterium]
MDIDAILKKVKEGNLSVDEASQQLRRPPYEDLGYACVDHHRELRNGSPEVIYCASKTKEQIAGIVRNLLDHGAKNILGTRVSREKFEAVQEICKDAEFIEIAGLIRIELEPVRKNKGKIAVITAGTSDMYVAEEAAATAEILGNHVTRIYDVGVAGIHRLFSRLDSILEANVVIVIAGMEGALPSVVGGLIDKPLIAVPTSVGYGANFGGLSALLGMLNSCASGMGVVNIDNGFGAGYLANRINRIGGQE